MDVRAIPTRNAAAVRRAVKTRRPVFLADANVGRAAARQWRNLTVLDHHGAYDTDGRNATEKALAYVKRHAVPENAVILTDNVDGDAVCSTFALANAPLALAHAKLLAASTRFSDFRLFSGDYRIRGKPERRLAHYLLHHINRLAFGKRDRTAALRELHARLAAYLAGAKKFGREAMASERDVAGLAKRLRTHLVLETPELAVFRFRTLPHPNPFFVGIAAHAATRARVVVRAWENNKVVAGVRQGARGASLLPALRRLEKREPGRWYGRSDVALCLSGSRLSNQELINAFQPKNA